MAVGWLLRENSTGYELNRQLLKDLCKRCDAKGVTQVCPISISGVFREGKSFLLNMLLHYLYELHRSQKSQSLDPVSISGSILDGFASDRGVDGVTQGVLMWDEPLILSTPSRDSIAVILIDTQGFMDSSLSLGGCAQLFAFSSLISSIQLHNVMKIVNENHLQHLALFTKYGMREQEEQEKKQGEKEQQKEKKQGEKEQQKEKKQGEKEQQKEKEHTAMFQNLIVVVRDFQYWDTYDFGVDGGRRYWEKVMAATCSDAGARATLSSSFSRIGCVLLPHPGPCVTDMPFTGKTEDLSAIFKRVSEEFFHSLCGGGASGGGALPAKTVQGEAVTPLMYYRYVKKCSQLLSSSPSLLPRGILAANRLVDVYKAVDGAKTQYRDAILQRAGSTRTSSRRVLPVKEDACAQQLINRLQEQLSGLCSDEEKQQHIERVTHYFEAEWQHANATQHSPPTTIWQRLVKTSRRYPIVGVAAATLFIALFALIGYALVSQPLTMVLLSSAMLLYLIIVCMQQPLPGGGAKKGGAIVKKGVTELLLQP